MATWCQRGDLDQRIGSARLWVLSAKEVEPEDWWWMMVTGSYRGNLGQGIGGGIYYWVLKG